MSVTDYARFYETLGPETPLETYRLFFDEAAYFEDPFHAFEGVENIYLMFQKMYDTLSDPLFRVDEIVESGDIAYLKWVFDYRLSPGGKPLQIVGTSRVEMKAGKVISHVDFWDAGQQVYEQIPLLGTFIRFVKRKIAR
jgi:hypothetical protein